MRPTLTASFLMGVALTVAPGCAQNFTEVPVIRNNPRGVVYQASLLNKDTTGVRGWVVAGAPPDGIGVIFLVNFWGFPDEEEFGPFSMFRLRSHSYKVTTDIVLSVYHIHVDPIPEDGNCSKALTHLDPYNRGEVPPCNASLPATCQVGDLSGKHGAIVAVPGAPFVVQYTDFYLSTSPESNAFFGNRSIVVHARNATRLNCGNFRLVEVDDDGGDSISALSASATGTGVASALPASAAATSRKATSTPSSGSSLFSAAVHTIGFSTGAILAAVAAFML